MTTGCYFIPDSYPKYLKISERFTDLSLESRIDEVVFSGPVGEVMDCLKPFTSSMTPAIRKAAEEQAAKIPQERIPTFEVLQHRIGEHIALCDYYSLEMGALYVVLFEGLLKQFRDECKQIAPLLMEKIRSYEDDGMVTGEWTVRDETNVEIFLSNIGDMFDGASYRAIDVIFFIEEKTRGIKSIAKKGAITMYRLLRLAWRYLEPELWRI